MWYLSPGPLLLSFLNECQHGLNTWKSIRKIKNRYFKILIPPSYFFFFFRFTLFFCSVAWNMHKKAKGISCKSLRWRSLRESDKEERRTVFSHQTHSKSPNRPWDIFMLGAAHQWCAVTSSVSSRGGEQRRNEGRGTEVATEGKREQKTSVPSYRYITRTVTTTGLTLLSHMSPKSLNTDFLKE